MTLSEFIHYNQLKPADAIMLNKKIFGMLDHYVIYLGIHNNKHTFVANYNKGVDIIPDADLQHFLKILVPKQIHRLNGNARDRERAVQRGISKIGEKAYNLLNNNCEHFKNYVQYGISKSTQSDSFKSTVGSVLIFGLAIGVLSSVLGGKGK